MKQYPFSDNSVQSRDLLTVTIYDPNIGIVMVANSVMCVIDLNSMFGHSVEAKSKISFLNFSLSSLFLESINLDDFSFSRFMFFFMFLE